MKQAEVNQNTIVGRIVKRQRLSEISGNILFAVATIFSEKSIPVGIALSSRTAADTYPGPHATSNTDIPDEI